MHRDAQGWTRKTLAHRAGCAVVTLQKIERDERRPSVELARLLVAALQLADADAQQLLAMLQPPPHAIATMPSAQAAPDFFGRTAEQQQIYRLLQGRQTRLLTLTGIGGVGKTRLAQSLLPLLRRAFPQGVYTVELAAVHHLELLLPAVARALNCPISGGMAAHKQIAKFVGEKEVLIYLDNFEQLLEGAAELTRLLAQCPNLCLLVTSREALRTAAETVLTVHPLSLPELDAPTNGAADVTAIAAWPAVALFVARAQNVRPDFVLTETNVEAVPKFVRCWTGCCWPLNWWRQVFALCRHSCCWRG
ncbi:MAG: helix-turn-helix domain-containing protein [Caldilineaceae bacterium]|nr:helix-turn-helix domain-containing protein [Caldilineaceae bacterium]